MLRSCRKSYVFLLLVCLFLFLVLFYSFSPTEHGISQNLRRENSSLVSFGNKLKDSIFTILAPSTPPPPLPAFDEKDNFHYHPKSMDYLWTRVTQKTIARRMAYFDTRDPNYTAVAFITMHDDRERIKPLLYAKLVYSNKSSVCTGLEYWGRSGELDLRPDVRELYVHYLMRNLKRIDSLVPPVMATLTTDSNCEQGHSETITIKDTREQKRDYDYGVCLHKGLYELHEPQLLLDWVELNLALGAKFITVYLQNVSDSYYDIMRPYMERGIVEVLDWKMLIPLVPEYTKHWGQTATVSECIFRNIYRVKYLGLIDVDEFFVPQKQLTIPEMFSELEQIKEAREAASYILYNAFLWNDGVSIPEVAHSKKCPSMKWPRYYVSTQRSSDPPAQYGYHKIIVKPLAVNTAWYHYIFAPWQKGYTKQYNVPAGHGLTHHYRLPEKNLDTPKVRTFTMSRYFNVTRKGIMQQMCRS